MQYDFDQEISRKGTNSAKWGMISSGEALSEWETTDAFFGEDRILPLWVADMDFRSPQPVIDALVQRAQHGIFGYTYQDDAYFEAVVDWMRRRQGWEIQPEWIVTTPGVVTGIKLIVHAFVQPGDKVIIQPPVYYPFFEAACCSGGELETNPLVYDGERYRMDFEDLEAKVANPKAKFLILCHPHNPVGRVWTREELKRLGDLCLEHDVWVISDEIHGDLIYSNYEFVPYATLGEAYAQKAFICTAPSKTFNLAGLKTSNMIVPNEDLRCQLQDMMSTVGVRGANLFGLEAGKIAYNEGEPWLDQVMAYIEDNLAFLTDYVAREIPEIIVIPPEGTYLVWLDCRSLGLDKMALHELVLEEAGVFLDDGFIFGQEGVGFQRINIACPRSVLAEALERIRDAIKARA
jgi:cystathionine beta-lyase